MRSGRGSSRADIRRRGTTVRLRTISRGRRTTPYLGDLLDIDSPPARQARGGPDRSLLLRVVLSLLALVGATAAVLTSVPTLGLDLRGGTQVVLEAQDAPTVKADAESTDRALEVLRRRVDALGVAEPTLVRAGDRRIVIELPGLQEPREAVEVIGRTAQLTFHPVLGVAAPGEQPPEGEGADPATG